MTTGRERIAAKARQESKLRFTSLAHHISKELVWESLEHIPKRTSPGVDGVTVYEAKESFKVGRKTEKSRLNRSLSYLKERMREIRHWSVEDQARKINQILRGHYAYYGMGGNAPALYKVYYFTQRYWHKMLCSRSQKGYIKWEDYKKLITEYPLQTPKIFIPYVRMTELSVL